MLNNMDLTVIIPVHNTKDEKFKELFERAENSVFAGGQKPQLFLSVTSNSANKEFFNNRVEKSNVECSFTTKKTFQDHVNNAVKQIKTKYFVVLEYDDEFSLKYFDNFLTYSQENMSDMYLPITVLIDDKTGLYKGTVNEVVWAKEFTNEQGYLDIDALTDWKDFNLTGAVIDRDAFTKSGGLKNNLKLSFNYEFMLRFLNNGYKIFTIPKIGYKHTINRDHSLTWLYSNDPDIKINSKEEMEFWFSAALNEFKYKSDRDIEIPSEYAKKEN